MANASPECVAALDTLQRVFARLGLPVPIEKLEGPWYRLSFLGFELDSHAMEIRLPPAKLTELRQLIWSWVYRHSCTRRELESLIGKLAHASKVVWLSIWWIEYVLIQVLQVALHHTHKWCWTFCSALLLVSNYICLHKIRLHICH